MLAARIDAIATEAAHERLRAAREEGYDLDHDLNHGGWRHPFKWASTWQYRAFRQPEYVAAREALVKAAGLLLATIDALDHEVATPKTQCPNCGVWVDDHDGFGVLAHVGPDGCGWCSHPSVNGGVCGVCEQEA